MVAWLTNLSTTNARRSFVTIWLRQVFTEVSCIMDPSSPIKPSYRSSLSIRPISGFGVRPDAGEVGELSETAYLQLRVIITL